MSKNDDIRAALAAIREHAEKIGVVASDLEDVSTTLSRDRKVLLTKANAIEASLEEEPPPPPPPPPDTDADITISIKPEPEQTFQAAGFSISRLGNPYEAGQVNATSHEFNRAAFDDLGTNIVRLWYDYSVPNFVKRYVQSGAIQAARNHGVEIFLLAPIPLNHPHVFDAVPRSWHTSRSPQDPGSLTPKGTVEQPRLVARHIRELRDQHGVIINATGQLNEPCSAWRTCVRPQDYVSYAILWRDALDDEELQNVKLIGLEWQPPRGQAIDYAKRIAADAAAKDSLTGLASHSYGFTIDDEIADLCRTHGWQHWQTEAGGTGSGSEIASRFLSDLNRCNTHWVFFLGPHSGTNEHTLLAPGKPVSFTSHYWALKALWRAFATGTVMRRTTSSLEGTMRWMRGDVRVNVAAGMRLDGRWAIGLSNGTGNASNQWRTFPDAQDYDVAIQLPPATTFDVQRVRDGQQSITSGETVTFHGGQGVLHIKSREVVVLVERD